MECSSSIRVTPITAGSSRAMCCWLSRLSELISPHSIYRNDASRCNGEAHLRQMAIALLLDSGGQAIPCNRQIGSEPDHDVRLEIWLLSEHGGRVPCMAEHLKLAIAVCR